MKRLVLFSLFVTFLITSTTAYAVDTEPFENSNMVKKVPLGNIGDTIYKFNSNGSVDIGGTHFSSCQELNKACAAY